MAKPQPTSTKQKSRVHRYCPKLDKMNFVLKCEWASECDQIFSSMDAFMKHIDEHVNDSANFECQWRDCDTDCFEDESSFKRHINFHAFHTKLKDIGQKVLDSLHENQKDCQKTKCNLDDQTRNDIPELPFKFECSWDCCDYTTDNPELFYQHIKQLHVDKFELKGTESKCLWSQCQQKIMNKNRLVEHTRHHSQEKLVACPNCGALFASFTKFIDHCSRSSSIGNTCFQCSLCNKKFATNNLLKEHIRKHVNKLKCPICEMTCIDNKDLNKHILYKHTNEKKFHCSQCSHSCKTQYDLQKHINLKHIERFEYECNECVYRSKDLDRIRKHMLKHHLNDIDLEKNFGTMYMCHVCKKTYSQGSTLSKHLKSVHNFQWPSGHSRFQYKLETDGFYRLQTLRYESPKLVKELNRTKDLEKLENSKIPDLPVNYESFDSSLISSIGTSSTSEYSSSNTVYDMTNQHLQLALPINLEPIEPDSADQSFLLNNKNEEIQKMEVECGSEKNYFVLVNTDMSQNLESQAERVEFDIENFLESNFRVKEKSFRENEISIFNSVEDPNESLDYKNIDLIQACSSKLL